MISERNNKRSLILRITSEMWKKLLKIFYRAYHLEKFKKSAVSRFGMEIRLFLKELNCYAHYKLGNYIPYWVELRVTNRCNLNCEFCGVKNNTIRVDELRTDEIFGIIDSLRKLGTPFIYITGGEPLLRADIIEIATYAEKNGLKAVLVTNGTLISRRLACKLAKHCYKIKISIDGLSRTHNALRQTKYAFEKTLKGINLLLACKKRKANVELTFVLTEKNHNELDAVARMFEDKVDKIIVQPLILANGIISEEAAISSWHKAMKNHKVIQQDYKFVKIPSFALGKQYCDAGKLYIRIEPDGSVRPCYKQPKIGNVRQNPLENILKQGIPTEVKDNINNCSGCYKNCTTLVSMFMRKFPSYTIKSLLRKMV